MKKLVIGILLAVSLIVGTACGAPGKTENAASDELMALTENDIHNAVILFNANRYLEGETVCEGHITLATEGTADTDEVTVYSLCTFGEYGFENDNFVKVSGSGVIPTRMTFLCEDGIFQLLTYEEPEDGAGYTESLKEMFPEALQERVLSISEEDRIACKTQEEGQAQSYLDSIGREAQIGEYGEFLYTYLHDLGVSTDVENEILCQKELAEYPMWEGTLERLIENTRYTYETTYDENTNTVIFRSYQTEHPESSAGARMVYSAETGERIE